MTVVGLTESYRAKRYKIVELACDLCGKKAASPRAQDDWSEGQYDVAETTVHIKQGRSYPEGNFLIARDYHVCPDCFKGKLEPWLRAQGARATEMEID